MELKIDDFNLKDSVYTLKEVAEILKVPLSSVRMLIWRDNIKYFKVGRNYRISKTALFEFIEDNESI